MIKMLPKYHIILGLIFAVLVFILFPEISFIGFFIIFLSSVLIDIDHYLFYIFARRDYSLKNAYKWFIDNERKYAKMSKQERKKIKQIPCILHGVEAIIILILLSVISKVFFYILIGFVFHQVLDFFNVLYDGYGFNHFGSQTYNFLKFNRKNY